MQHFYFVVVLPPIVPVCKELLAHHVFLAYLLLCMIVKLLLLSKSVNSFMFKISLLFEKGFTPSVPHRLLFERWFTLSGPHRLLFERGV